MSQQKLPKIDRRGENLSYHTVSDYAFVFSDDVRDWQSSKQRKINKENYERKKAATKKAKGLSKQKPHSLDAGATRHEVETKRKTKHPKHKPHTKAANLHA